jgi:hypothetical protein
MIEQRKHARFAINWRGTCTSEAGVSVDVRIVDCADGSFGVSGLHNFTPGDGMELHIGGVGSFPCQIVWVKGERFGARILDAWADREMLHLTDYLERT